MRLGKLLALLRGSNQRREVVQVDPEPQEHVEKIEEVTIDWILPEEDLWIPVTTPSGDSASRSADRTTPARSHWLQTILRLLW